ncbi:hypothetical protein ACLOJK_023152 [Asimina triloba]
MAIGSSIPVLDKGTVESDSNMPPIRGPTQACIWSIVFIHSDKLRNGVSEGDCYDIATAPVKQIQTVIIHNLWGIQLSLGRLHTHDSEREQLCGLMNCQELSLEACNHAAQNERILLRVVVQVLFFEQLRLWTSIAGGGFFVSDNLETGQGLQGSLSLPNYKNDASTLAENGCKSKEIETICMDDMKLRVSEL